MGETKRRTQFVELLTERGRSSSPTIHRREVYLGRIVLLSGLKFPMGHEFGGLVGSFQ